MEPARTQLLRLTDHARRLEIQQNLDVLWDVIADTIEMASAGEEGLAFECFCDNLYDSGLRLTPDFLRQTESVADLCGVPRERCAFLSRLVE
jgi:hypothetical protein